MYKDTESNEKREARNIDLNSLPRNTRDPAFALRVHLPDYNQRPRSIEVMATGIHASLTM